MTQQPVEDPQQLAALPVLPLDDPASADLELVLEGLLRTSSPLGGALRSVADGVPAGDRATVVVPDHLHAAVRAAGGALLVDAESTPLARLHDLVAEEAVDAPVHGRVERLRHPERGLGLALQPARHPVPRGAHLVVLRRPPLLEDLESLPGEDGPVVLVVPVGGPTPDGVPAETLLRLARAAGHDRQLHVAAVPITWRDRTTDRLLIEELATGLASSRVRVLAAAVDDGPDVAWTTVLATVENGGPVLPPVVDRRTARELRWWRPLRPDRGLVVLFTGLSGSGKSTLARGLAEHLTEEGDRRVSLLDGDVVRRLLSAGLGFDAEARDLNVRRIGFVAAEVARQGGIALCAPIAPYARSRRAVRAMAEAAGDFVLVHVSTPVEECERRDLKGLYARARAGSLTGMTGVDDPYEVPTDADLAVDTSELARAAALSLVVEHLVAGGWLRGRDVDASAP